MAAAYDEMAEDYHDRYSRPIHVAEDRIVQAALQRWVTPPVIDVGCGTGAVLDWIDIEAGEYLGIDPSSGMIHEAFRLHPNNAFLTMSLKRAALLTATCGSRVNTVTAIGSLQYTEDLHRTFRYVAHLLPGPGVVIATLMGPGWDKRKSLASETHGDLPFVRPTIKQIRDAAEAAGFYCVRLAHFSCFVDRIPGGHRLLEWEHWYLGKFPQPWAKYTMLIAVKESDAP